MFVIERKENIAEASISSLVKRDLDLDKLFSDKKLGSYVENGNTIFRIFAPSASQVRLCLFNNPEDQIHKEYFMTKDNDGVWEIEINSDLNKKYYGYKVYHPEEDLANSYKPICIDPYSKAITTFTSYFNPRLSIVLKDEYYDWEETSWQKIDWRDLIIYEMHLRDMTAHKSSGAKKRGTYAGLIEKGIKGGIEYIKSLGVNAVEFMPVHEFGYCEAPYRVLKRGFYNAWNPYERNHWGYMTASFFAPASYYTETNFRWNKWIGKDGKQINEFKNVVKAFHKEGIAVIMDVVFNHLSQYELGNLKQIDKDYYFRLDENGGFISQSGCGNDLKTERPMVRRLIIDSLLYWMKEYHIDGFRFDLGSLIDWETIETISKETRKLNPDVILIAEAWGGNKYNLKEFSEKNFAAWNDQIRNGIKGENPFTGLGWIFGKWYDNNSREKIKSYVKGTLKNEGSGIFYKQEHSVNYLESHDGYTLGDFIRIATNKLAFGEKIKNINKFIKLSPEQMKLNKLAALFLFTSQGIVMIHEGLEFARSKIISFRSRAHDKHKNEIDFNSYNKDNSTNYINYFHKELNEELFDYYKGLIQLRRTCSAFRKAEDVEISFYDHYESEFAFSYLIKDRNEYFIVLFNPEQNKNLEFPLPDGNWDVLVDGNFAGIKPLYKVSKKIELKPVTGVVLKQAH